MLSSFDTLSFNTKIDKRSCLEDSVEIKTESFLNVTLKESLLRLLLKHAVKLRMAINRTANNFILFSISTRF